MKNDTDQKKKTEIKKKSVSEKKLTKKNERQEIVDKLKDALSDLKTSLGEKKFNSRLKKASKLLAGGKKKSG